MKDYLNNETTDDPIEITDAHLAQLVKKETGREDAVLTAQDAKQIKTLGVTVSDEQNFFDYSYPEDPRADSLRQLTLFSGLTHLGVACNTTDITPISMLSHLTHLIISCPPETDFSPLVHLHRLRTLKIIFECCHSVPDLSPLSSLTNLEHFAIFDNLCDMLDLSFLNGMQSLKTLSLGANRLTGAQALSALAPSLTLLSLRSANPIEALPDLALFSHLEHLLILAPLPSLDVLSGTTSLCSVNIHTDLPLDLTPLVTLPRLSRLVLFAPFMPGSEQYLSRMTNLRDLVIKNEQLSDISFLSDLTGLEELALYSCRQVRDITPLAGLTNLTKLRLPANSIEDVSPLAALTSLHSLSLSHNPVRDISPLAGLKNLEFLSLVGTKVTDLSPVSGVKTVLTPSYSDTDLSPVSSGETVPVSPQSNTQGESL